MTLQEEVEKLRRFKLYVHTRLDAAGVPTDPESPHKAEGCRVGGRLDWMIARLSPEPKTAHYSIRNPETDEPWHHLGGSGPELERAIGLFVAAEIDANNFATPDGFDAGPETNATLTVEIKRQMLTAAEVAAIPEE